jgi:hypothetical protein
LLFSHVLLLGVLRFGCKSSAIFDDSVYDGPPPTAIKLHLFNLLVSELLGGVVIHQLAVVVGSACCAEYRGQAIRTAIEQRRTHIQHCRVGCKHKMQTGALRRKERTVLWQRVA